MSTPGFWPDALRLQAAGCAHLGSALYAGVLEALAAEVDAGRAQDFVAALDATGAVDLASAVARASALRLLGGLHEAALTGAAPDLARHLPSTGGQADPAGFLAAAASLLRPPSPALRAALGRDPQTNEVGRAALLAGGLRQVAAVTGLPLRVFEIGASAGLNLRLDHYDVGRGLPIVERRGCDLHPLDPTTDAGRVRLLAYCWPDQTERLARLRAALDVAAQVPVTVDAVPADAWVEAHVRTRPGSATVLVHSIVWQYLPDPAKERIAATLAAHGERTGADAPLAWLRMEPSADGSVAETSLTSWPGGATRLLARSGFHGADPQWLGPS